MEDVNQLLMATSAIPGVFAPVVFHGRALADCGMYFNNPAKVLFNAGYRNLIVIYNTNIIEVKDSIKEIRTKLNNIIEIIPSQNLGNSIEIINFDHNLMMERIELGYSDTKKKHIYNIPIEENKVWIDINSNKKCFSFKNPVQKQDRVWMILSENENSVLAISEMPVSMTDTAIDDYSVYLNEKWISESIGSQNMKYLIEQQDDGFIVNTASELKSLNEHIRKKEFYELKYRSNITKKKESYKRIKIMSLSEYFKYDMFTHWTFTTGKQNVLLRDTTVKKELLVNLGINSKGEIYEANLENTYMVFPVIEVDKKYFELQEV